MKHPLAKYKLVGGRLAIGKVKPDLTEGELWIVRRRRDDTSRPGPASHCQVDNRTCEVLESFVPDRLVKDVGRPKVCILAARRKVLTQLASARAGERWERKHSPQAGIVLKDVVSGQMAQVEACRVWLRVGGPRHVKKMAANFNVPVQDGAQGVNGNLPADVFAVAG